MKHTTLNRTLLSLALLGALCATPSLTKVARADAPDVADRADDDRPYNRREDGFGRRGQFGDRPDFGGRERRDPRAGRAGRERAGFGRRDDNWGRDDKRGRADFEGRNQGRGRAELGRRGPGRDGMRPRERAGRLSDTPLIAPQFSGVVTKVKNDREFDVRIDGKTYNVYLTTAAGAVSVGQSVGINGQRVGNNDIRSATVLQPRRR